MKAKSNVLITVFAAITVVGGYAISPAWAQDEQAKPALSASAAPSGAVSVEPVNAKQLSTPIAGAQDYRIGQNDLLEIRVFQAEPFNRNVRVSSSGYISMPLIGLIEAGGLTAPELERVIATKLEEKYMRDPQVNVFVTEYTSQRVTIEGAVKNPGVYTLKGRTTLRQALALSAGTDYLADLSEIRVTRFVDGERKMISYDLEAIREGKAEDPMVLGNDIILVETSAGRSILKGVLDTLRGFISFGTL